ncbi:MAG: YcjF family protein [Isosphaeraceae bacterium]
MNRTIRTVALMAGGTVVLTFVIVVANQTTQFVQLTSTIHPTLGQVTLWSLLTGYATMLGVPVVLFVRLPRPLRAPEVDKGPEFEEHLRLLSARLATSPHLSEHGLQIEHPDRESIERALVHLDDRANAIVTRAASSVFLSTAVSQSGRLDGLIVLAAQSRMVWKLAHVYYQRPGLREMFDLYTNVAATALVAGELQDVDLSEQVEPVLGAALSAVGASVPGLQVAGSLLATCVLDGSANAFLTLRVGMIAKRQCAPLVVQPRAAVRRAATSEAAQLLGSIVAEGTGQLSKALWRASMDRVGDAVNGFSGKAKDATSRLFARVRSAAQREHPEAG